MNVTIARYALGVASLLIVCGSMSLAALALRRRFFPDFAGAMARMTEALIALALLIGVLEVLGTVALFRLVPIVVACAAVGCAAVWGAGRSGSAVRRGERAARRVALPVLATALAITAVVFAEWASPTLQAYDTGIHVVDSMWYHMPWAASFAQTGHITPLRFTDVEFLTAFYPATTEMLHGLGIVLLARDTLSPGLNLLFLALALLAAYCVGRARGAGPASLAGVALVMATPMMFFSQPGSADNDVIGVFFLLAAVALLVNGEGSRPSWVLAAVAAGLAAAIKLTFLGPVLALTIGALVIARRRERVSAAGLWLGALLLAGGFWYARNLIAVGNPLPWTSLGLLPTPAPPLARGTTFAISHYLTDGRIWSQFAQPAFASGLGRWWFAILAAAVLGPLLCLLPGASRTLRVLALVALASLASYLVTPNSAMGPQGDPVGIAYNVRYAVPGLALSFAITPLAPALGALRRQAALILAVAVVLAATLAKPALWPAQHVGGEVALGIVVGTLALVAALRASRRAVVAICGSVLIALAVGGYPWQRHYLRGRYAFRPGISHLSRIWALFREIHHSRVAFVGTYLGYFSYPLDGVDDSNRVQYVAHHGPHGSFTPITTCPAWRSAVNAGHYRYLVTTPLRDFWTPRKLRPSPEGAWTASDSAAHVVLSGHVSGLKLTVYELNGTLNTATCS